MDIYVTIIIGFFVAIFLFFILNKAHQSGGGQRGGGDFTSGVGMTVIIIFICVLIFVIPAFVGFSNSPSYYIF
jgi:heme/copper-type cytochrome/quinol oxidase subunit 2